MNASQPKPTKRKVKVYRNPTLEDKLEIMWYQLSPTQRAWFKSHSAGFAIGIIIFALGYFRAGVAFDFIIIISGYSYYLKEETANAVHNQSAYANLQQKVIYKTNRNFFNEFMAMHTLIIFIWFFGAFVINTIARH